MAKIRLFGVDIDVSINSEEAHDEMELCMRLKSPHAVSKNWLRVYNPTPLRFCPPKTDHKTRVKLGRKKRSMKRRGAEDHEADPVIPSRLLQLIESREGTTKPIFLYQKRLTSSDVDKHENRLFVTRRERVMNKFLSEDEGKIVNDGTTKGLREIVTIVNDSIGVDAPRESYKLGLNIWSSVNIMVINSEWYTLVKENVAEIGDWVQIWGYREVGAPCFAINFMKA